MSAPPRYRDFGNFTQSADESIGAESSEIEDQKLDAFEEGYKAGWDDALKSQQDEKNKIASDFAQNMQDIGFTFHEALGKLTSSMEPLLREIVAKLLPQSAQMTLGVHVLDQLQDMLRCQAEQPIEIVVAPGQRDAVAKVIGAQIKAPFSLVEDSILGLGQAQVRIGEQEREIDLDAVIHGIEEAMTAFFHETDQEQNNG